MYTVGRAMQLVLLIHTLMSPLFNMYLNLVFVLYLGSERPFERMQPALMLYVNEDLLRGKEATHQNISVRFYTLYL